MSEWKTGHPDKNGEYIVMIEGARKPTCLDFDLKLDGEENIWHDDWNWYNVTHWMELPEPPEEAIPISYIEKRAKRYSDRGLIDLSVCLEALIMDWECEHAVD